MNSFILSKWSAFERVLLSIIVTLTALRLFSLPFYPFLDRSEARYALIPLHMLISGNWVTPSIDGHTPFWSKPPLSFWLTALSYKEFGINEFAGRLPSFLGFVATLWLVFWIGRKMRDRAFGLLSAAIFGSMGFVYFQAGAVMTDPGLALCVTLSMAAFWAAMTGTGKLSGYLVFVGFGLALLVKGPIGIVLPALGMLAWIVFQGQWREVFSRLPVVTGTLLMLAIAAPWYILAESRTPGFLQYFIVGEHIGRYLEPGWKGSLYEPGLKAPIGMVWLFAIFASLPWSVFVVWLAARHFWRKRPSLLWLRQHPDICFLLCWAVVPLIFLTFSRNLLVTYVLPLAPAFALLTAFVIRAARAERSLFAFALMAIAPLLGIFMIGFVQLRPDSISIPSQSRMIALWKQQRGAQDEPLYYIFQKPYSADFYTRTRAENIRTRSDIDDFPNKPPPFFFIVREKDVAWLSSASLQKATLIGSRNGTLLYRTRQAPAPSNN